MFRSFSFRAANHFHFCVRHFSILHFARRLLQSRTWALQVYTYASYKKTVYRFLSYVPVIVYTKTHRLCALIVLKKEKKNHTHIKWRKKYETIRFKRLNKCKTKKNTDNSLKLPIPWLLMLLLLLTYLYIQLVSVWRCLVSFIILLQSAHRCGYAYKAHLDCLDICGHRLFRIFAPFFTFCLISCRHCLFM